jgi:hypothetical protein
MKKSGGEKLLKRCGQKKLNILKELCLPHDYKIIYYILYVEL